MNVVHRLEPLRPDALHVPQMKEFVRREGFNSLQPGAKALRGNADGGAVAVFHSAPAAGRKVKDERVAGKGHVAHQGRFGGRNLLERTH